MNRMVLLILGLTFSLNSYSQDRLWRIDKEVTEYYTDTLYCQINLRYSNTSDSAIVLWIEKNNVDSLSNLKKIKNHFFTRKGDWSFMQIILDGNVESFVPGLFDMFMKIIKPNEQFTVSILKKGKISTDMMNLFEKRVVIVNARDIKGLQINNSIEMFNYKAQNVIILADWIK